MANSNVANL